MERVLVQFLSNQRRILMMFVSPQKEMLVLKKDQRGIFQLAKKINHPRNGFLIFYFYNLREMRKKKSRLVNNI